MEDITMGSVKIVWTPQLLQRWRDGESVASIQAQEWPDCTDTGASTALHRIVSPEERRQRNANLPNAILWTEELLDRWRNGETIRSIQESEWPGRTLEGARDALYAVVPTSERWARNRKNARLIIWTPELLQRWWNGESLASIQRSEWPDSTENAAQSALKKVVSPEQRAIRKALNKERNAARRLEKQRVYDREKKWQRLYGDVQPEVQPPEPIVTRPLPPDEAPGLDPQNWIARRWDRRGNLLAVAHCPKDPSPLRILWKLHGQRPPWCAFYRKDGTFEPKRGGVYNNLARSVWRHLAGTV